MLTPTSSKFAVWRCRPIFLFGVTANWCSSSPVDARAWHAGESCWRGRLNCNDHSVGIELEGLEGDPFEPAQYETLTSLCAALAKRLPIAHIAGHEHIAPGRKRDPGPGFDWTALQRNLGWSAARFPSPDSSAPNVA